MSEAVEIAIKLAKQFEGCKLEAYWDSHGECWTIGYGCTGREINHNTVWTQDRAEAELRCRINKCHNMLIAENPNLSRESAGRQAALTDFIYNLGIGSYRTSSLKKCVDSGNWEGAKHEILKWTHAGGKVLAGLVARREAEEELL